MQTSAKLNEPPITRVQVNWKRREGIATRYELEQAVQSLIERGKVEIADGLLSLPRVKERGELRMRLALAGTGQTDVERRRDRWARQDDALRAYCQQMDVHETPSKRASEILEMQSSSLFEASACRGVPRPGVTKYVLRELRENGPTGYEALIDTIFAEGGFDWVSEEPQRTFRKTGKGGRRR